MRKTNQFLFLISIAFCLFSFIWLLKALFLGYYPDFSGYYFGSKYLLTGLNPYLGGGSLFTSYVYPPIVLLFFLPFTILTFQTAEIIWTILSLVFLLVSLKLLSSMLDIKFFSRLNLFLMSLVFISFPIKFSFGMGQINLFVLCLLVFSLWFFKRKKEFLSGVFLGLSLAIKLFPLLLPVYFLFQLKKKVLLGLFVSFLISVFLVLIIIPNKISWQFITNVLPSFFTSWKLDYYNQSLAGFIGRSFGTGQISISLKIIISGILVCIAFFTVFKNRQEDFVSFSLKYGTLITASLLINTFSWQHHFVWLIIPMYTIFIYIKNKKLGVLYFSILAISYILISINFKNPKILPIILQSHVFLGTLILLLLNLYLLIKKKNF